MSDRRRDLYRERDRPSMRRMSSKINLVKDSALHRVEDSALVNRAKILAEDIAQKAEDIETTINALALRSISLNFHGDSKKSDDDHGNIKLPKIAYLKKILKLKTKKIDIEKKNMKDLHIAKQKCEASINSFTARVNELVSKKNHKQILETELNLRVILLNEEMSNCEIVNMSLRFNEQISVQELIDRIPHHAKNPSLAKQYYDAICLENAFVLDKGDPIQKYLMPSNEKQIIIAVPSVNTCKRLVKLAKPIIENARRIEKSTQKDLRRSIHEIASVHGNELANLIDPDDQSLPLLLRAAENDSSKSFSNTPASPVNAIDVIYMILAVMFIFVTHNSSK